MRRRIFTGVNSAEGLGSNTSLVLSTNPCCRGWGSVAAGEGGAAALAFFLMKFLWRVFNSLGVL